MSIAYDSQESQEFRRNLETASKEKGDRRTTSVSDASSTRLDHTRPAQCCSCGLGGCAKVVIRCDACSAAWGRLWYDDSLATTSGSTHASSGRWYDLVVAVDPMGLSSATARSVLVELPASLTSTTHVNSLGIRCKDNKQ